MKVRSTVSADISQHVIWVNSTDFDSTVKAVKVHEILVNEFGTTTLEGEVRPSHQSHYEGISQCRSLPTDANNRLVKNVC